MQLGRYYLERLKFGIEKRDLNLSAADPQIKDIVNQRFVEFPTLSIKWPKVDDITSVEQAKVLFRLGNTQYKKALEFYVLDGCVTEHVNIKKDISSLYKMLSKIDTDPYRVFGMLERRRDLLEPIVTELNPKAFENTWQILLNELGEIYNEMFEMKADEAAKISKTKKAGITESLVSETNSYGLKCVEHLSQVIEFYERSMVNQPESKEEFLDAIVNKKLIIGRIFYRFLDKDPKQIVEYLSKSWKIYESTKALLDKEKNQNGVILGPKLIEKYNLCKEMCDLLPHKIKALARS